MLSVELNPAHLAGIGKATKFFSLSSRRMTWQEVILCHKLHTSGPLPSVSQYLSPLGGLNITYVEDIPAN